jgi:hypothetical protein
MRKRRKTGKEKERKRRKTGKEKERKKERGERQ